MRNILRECMGTRSANGGRIMAEKRGVTLVETTSRKIIGDIIETIILDAMRVHKCFRNTDRESLRKIDMQTMLELLNGE